MRAGIFLIVSFCSFSFIRGCCWKGTSSKPFFHPIKGRPLKGQPSPPNGVIDFQAPAVENPILRPHFIIQPRSHWVVKTGPLVVEWKTDPVYSAYTVEIRDDKTKVYSKRVEKNEFVTGWTATHQAALSKPGWHKLIVTPWIDSRTPSWTEEEVDFNVLSAIDITAKGVGYVVTFSWNNFPNCHQYHVEATSSRSIQPTHKENVLASSADLNTHKHTIIFKTTEAYIVSILGTDTTGAAIALGTYPVTLQYPVTNRDTPTNNDVKATVNGYVVTISWKHITESSQYHLYVDNGLIAHEDTVIKKNPFVIIHSMQLYHPGPWSISLYAIDSKGKVISLGVTRAEILEDAPAPPPPPRPPKNRRNF